MSSAADASLLTLFLGRLSVHQDLLWFGVLVGWSLVFALWWRHPRRDALWRLLPWLAAARGLGAVMQFFVFNPPLDLFIDILIPGSNARYVPAALDPFLTADLVLAGLSYGLIVVWLWQEAAGRSLGALWRGLGLAALVLALAVHLVWPGVSAWVLAALPLLAIVRLLAREEDRHSPRWLMTLAAFAPALSTVGPLAWHGGMMQRTAAATPAGVLAAGFQLLLAGLLLVHLWRLQPASAPGTEVPRRVRQPYLLTAAGLLAVGVGYAVFSGEEHRREVIANRLRATMHNAGLLEAADFAAFTAPSFRLTGITATPDGTGTARVPGIRPAQEAAARALAARVRATQFQETAGFLVLADGWLVEAAGTVPRPHPEGVILRGRATPDDEAAWREQRLFVRASPVPEQGAPYYCRAPVLAADGRMLGWLEFPREEFYSSMARKWRTGPLLITALGVVLTVVLYFQKRSNLERERAARAAAAEAEANRLKTAFLAKVSHELRTPIQSLLGYGELLRSRVGDDPTARAWLGALQQHGEIMTRLINDLLDISAAESGSFRLTPGPVAPAVLVRQVVEGLAPRAAAKRLLLTCVATPAVPAWVEADGGRLSQIVMNLVGNAIKFTDAGEIHVHFDATAATGGRGRLVLTVRDTGPGIAPAEQAKLFEPFSRLDRTAAKEGTGLGLALSAALCRAMGGSLRVESDGRTGSSFIAECELPLAAEPVAAPLVPSPAAAVAPGTSAPVVLVIEDNTLLRELFISYLAGQGCTCTAAGSGAVALTRVKAVTPGVILLDLSLPDANGIELVPALRTAAPGARIIGVSAHAGDADRERALAAGMDAFFTKPVPLATLGAAVFARTRPDPEPAATTYQVPAHLRNVFREELTGLREELAGAVTAGDLPRVRRRAHYLRNSALVVEARTLLDACTALETAAEHGVPALATEAWPRCEAAIVELLGPNA